MNEQTISRFAVPDIDTLPDDVRQRIEDVQEKAGFVPNIFLALAHRPDEFRAFFAYHDALMLREDSSLSKAEREMIVVATSAANDCQYCIIAHGAILRIYAKNPYISDQLATNYRQADITPRQRAMLDFAVKVATSPALISQSDHQALSEAGFDADAVWDIGNIAAFFALSNRLAHVAEVPSNPEFYGMAR